MLACLVHLLENGADPLLEASTLLKTLIEEDVASKCSHKDIGSVKPAESVPTSFISGRTEDAALDRNVFGEIL